MQGVVAAVVLDPLEYDYEAQVDEDEHDEDRLRYELEQDVLASFKVA